MPRFDSWKAILLSCVFWFVAPASAPAQTFTTLYSFCSQTNCTDGSEPVAPLIQGLDGNFYGTTQVGGSSNNCPNGCGTAFKITPTGTLTTLHSFCSQSGCPDGEGLYAPLDLATNGHLYGATSGGGANGQGTVFEMTAGGALTTLHSFCAQTGCPEAGPGEAGLIQATNGDFYGTTDAGGANGQGTVFEMTVGGALTTLHSFCAQTGCPDGLGPEAGLIQATNGDLYGVTPFNGIPEYCTVGDGCGTIFKMTLGGTLSALYTFCKGGLPCTDGAAPGWNLYSGGGAGLVQGADGNFYGTTYYGGEYGYGTVFKITPGGTLTTLYSFCAQDPPYCTDGANPNAGLIQGTDGNFYGTTQAGGNGKLDGYAGTIFKITPGGELTTLYSFCSQPNCADGEYPAAGLVQATNGRFYGTNTYGGANNGNCVPESESCGTVFSLDVGLGPFVETNPTSGNVGAPVTVLGNKLTGATSVTFNGVAAKPFNVNSTGTAITTTVPSGATTGYVKVTTASGKILTSNLKFRIP